jgi:hypothetical protein
VTRFTLVDRDRIDSALYQAVTGVERR